MISNYLHEGRIACLSQHILYETQQWQIRFYFFSTFMIVTHDQNNDAFELITTMSFIFYGNIVIYVGIECTHYNIMSIAGNVYVLYLPNYKYIQRN